MTNIFTRQNHRIYPDKGGVEYFSQDMGNQRFIWNHFLALNIAKYEAEKKFIFHFEMCYMLPKLKEEFPFLKLGNSAALQSTLRQLDTALKGSFKSTKIKFARDSLSSRSFPVLARFVILKPLKLPTITYQSLNLRARLKLLTMVKVCQPITIL